MSSQSLPIWTEFNSTTTNKFPYDLISQNDGHEQAKISEFTYTSKRMGDSSITATLNYRDCLDNQWTKKEFVEFNGERYYIKEVPTSSKDNSTCTYKHELTFYPRREILNNIYFFDYSTTSGKYASNSTKIIFSGDITEFVGRLNASLKKSFDNASPYSVVIDSGITSEVKQISMEDKFITEALQEIFNTYELPYYWQGTTCHVGYTSNAITTPFEYGKDKGLISITKTNANYKIVNRCTGIGSTENIPFYYPNPSNDRAKIVADGGTWITPCSNLMPSIYRQTSGSDRFYNAINDSYKIPDTDDYYEFPNEYSINNQKEMIVSFENIKPTIKGVKNAEDLNFDTIADIAYDSDDNDQVDDNGNYYHPYFYVKLNKFDGTYGFNLFEQALETESAYIELTTGNCSSCKFEIQVVKEETTIDGELTYIFHNPVQVDSKGNIVNGTTSDKIKVGDYQDVQQDTRLSSVWIAVKKDNTTLGVVIPNQQNNYKPSAGDTFVITGIKMPETYIRNAENELSNAIIKYMSQNNDSKYTFNVSFSRIYLERNKSISNDLNENASIIVKYNGIEVPLYISSYTYKNDAEILPQIEVELSETITLNQSTFQERIDSVKQDVMNSVGSIDMLKMGLKHFIRKDAKDVARELITFAKGLKLGYETSPYGIEGDGDAIFKDAEADSIKVNSEGFLRSHNFNSNGVVGEGYGLTNNETQNKISKLEVDELYVRMKAVFNQLEIRELSYVGGNMVLSAAGSTITDVDNGTPLYDSNHNIIGRTSYRCYFSADNNTTDTMNYWRVGDLARCEQFNIGDKPMITSEYSEDEIITEEGLDYIGIEEGSLTDAEKGKTTRFYWRKVIGVGTDSDGRGYVDLGDDSIEKAEGSVPPMQGDRIVQFGNVSDTSRQNLIMLYVVGDEAPSIEEYKGICDFSPIITKRLTRISPEGDEFYAKSFKIVTSEEGKYVPIARDLGDWVSGKTYYYYDRVSYNGSLYLCINENGLVTSTPSESSTDWEIQVKQGTNGVSYTGTDEYYQWHNSDTTAPTGTWSKNSVPTKPTDTSYRFLWNYEVINKSNGESETKAAHVMSSDGRGIKKVDEYYKTTSTSTTPSESEYWNTTKVLPTSVKPYLWNKEVVTYNDNSTETNIRLLAQRGENGTNGTNGTDGTNGTNGTDGISFGFDVSTLIVKADNEGNPSLVEGTTYYGIAQAYARIGANMADSISVTNIQYLDSNSTFEIGTNGTIYLTNIYTSQSRILATISASNTGSNQVYTANVYLDVVVSYGATIATILTDNNSIKLSITSIKTGLVKAGIDIDEGGVTIVGNKFTVKTPQPNSIITLSTDSNGRLISRPDGADEAAAGMGDSEFPIWAGLKAPYYLDEANGNTKVYAPFRVNTKGVATVNYLREDISLINMMGSDLYHIGGEPSIIIQNGSVSSDDNPWAQGSFNPIKSNNTLFTPYSSSITTSADVFLPIDEDFIGSKITISTTNDVFTTSQPNVGVEIRVGYFVNLTAQEITEMSDSSDLYTTYTNANANVFIGANGEGGGDSYARTIQIKNGSVTLLGVSMNNSTIHYDVDSTRKYKKICRWILISSTAESIYIASTYSNIS